MAAAERIRIGNQTAFSAVPFDRPFRYAIAQGFDAFEWFPDVKNGGGWMAGDVPAQERRSLRHIARQHGLRISMHASCGVNPARPECRRQLEQDCAFARDAGAQVLIVHACLAEGLEDFVTALEALRGHLAPLGIGLAIENTPLTGPEEINDLFRRIAERRPDGAAGSGLCFDMGHANVCAATRNDYLGFFDALASHVPVAHVHAHENRGDADSHLTLFTGPAAGDPAGIRGLVKRLVVRGYAGSIILEQWPEPPDLLAAARDRLRMMIAEASGAPPPALAAEDAAGLIAGIDRRHGSWREKLGAIEDLLNGRPSAGTLACIALYLRCIGTGAVACHEDGRHFRPGHQGRRAQRMHARLSELETPETAFVIRKIYPWLPSCDRRFSSAEPLTRIRDIAHRSDIPAALKREIKTTLQNKLHRCAGPEDLAASAALRDRVLAAREAYPRDFVDQLCLFHEELREFFNARTLEEQLQALSEPKGDMQPDLSEAVRRFVKLKNGAETPGRLTGALAALTRLRRRLSAHMQGAAGHSLQQYQLADIALEDYAFVLASRLLNACADGGLFWRRRLASLGLLLENLSADACEAAEVRALNAEVRALRREFDDRNPDELLRLKAVVERTRRLADGFCMWVIGLFAGRAEALGQALGVSAPCLTEYCETAVRRHLMFQIAKLLDMLQEALRGRGLMPPWDVVVPGRPAGLVAAAHTPGAIRAPEGQNVIALVKTIDDDEDGAPAITGIICSRPVNHLSHFAIRCRQRGIVLAVCLDRKLFAGLQRAAGGTGVLDASPGRVNLMPECGACAARSAPAPGQKTAMRNPGVLLASGPPIVPLEHVRPETGGGKAYGAARLAALSHSPDAGFVTAPGLVVPFGIMEAAIEQAGAGQDYCGLRALLQRDDGAAARLHALVAQLAVPAPVVQAVRQHFEDEERLMIRSSCSSEDLEHFAGAGLYDSLPNVAPADAGRAIAAVWASLWSARAVSGRARAGLPHLGAHMAVLVQKMLNPDYSFVLHTLHPLSRGGDAMCLELAAGLGEVLARTDEPGVPCRISVGRQSGVLRMEAWPSFSCGRYPAAGGGVERRAIDYSALGFFRDAGQRRRLALRLAGIGLALEAAFGAPQDIEGCVCGETLYLLQSRRQQGLSGPAAHGPARKENRL